MAAITATKTVQEVPGRGTIIRWSGTSATNQADTLTTDAMPGVIGMWTLESVTVSYDGAATYTGTALTVTLDSGLGAVFDNVLSNGTDNSQYFSYIPTGRVRLCEGDAIIVAAPAGGAGREASIVITIFSENR